ncbi:hypothetical protein [Lutibacter sp.]
MLVTAVLLPIAIQFSHALKPHEHTVCTSHNIVHLHKKEIDCSSYHYQVQNNAFAFSTNFTLQEVFNFRQEIISIESQKNFISIRAKSSRAPPTVLL